MKQSHKKQKAIKLRLNGKSYNEIRKILDVASKGTLNDWFRNLSLPAVAQKRLEQKMLLAKERGLLKFNELRSKKIIIENKKIFSAASEYIRALTERELLIAGISLYWGEGYKKTDSLSLANSDPNLIIFYMRFIREVLHVPDDKIRTHINVHENLDTTEAVRFWAKITKLPAKNFIIVKLVSRASQFKRPKNCLPYGTLDIRVYSRQIKTRVMGLLSGLAKQGGLSYLKR